ncbi:hypothetical protein MRB53_030275 [Persea americana]|uniref:Uncharacterized protein n=1 Tax=Persea americana TaxID=3435 RepID=A0ACC2KKU7_PERAE|nr:hypothetical protein MRB53_030275 [Persea americana]
MRMSINGGFGLDVVGLNTLIDGYCKFGMVNYSVRLMESMRQEGVLPDIVTYITLINGFCRIGEFGKAKDFMDEILGIKKDVSSSKLNCSKNQNSIEEMDLELNVITHTTFISAYCKKRELEEAFSLYEEMV